EKPVTFLLRRLSHRCVQADARKRYVPGCVFLQSVFILYARHVPIARTQKIRHV
ncbi:hypothetical protein BaRGS_00002144, partial [Batillaria attramentaria]